MYVQNPHPRLRNTRPLLLQIPEEILNDEILPRLPVKSLSRFKCVSKPWQSLIESDRFIKIQYRNSAKKPRVVFSPTIHKMNECSLLSMLKKEGSSVAKKELRAGILVDCCNGVVCSFSGNDGIFSLWNPATGASMDLPKVDGVVTKRGFGWDESSGAYKVFAVLSYRKHNENIGRIYSSNTNSWRTVPHHGSLSVFTGYGVLVGGNLHWVKMRCSLAYEIESFDLGREEFGRIEINSIAPKDKWLWLGDIGGCLGMLSNNNKVSDVWVMKEYGVKESWFKLFSFPPNPLSENSVCRSIAFVPFFGECPNGDVFVIYRTDLMVYSPKDDAFIKATNNVDFIAAGLYVESLVSPKRFLDATNTS